MATPSTFIKKKSGRKPFVTSSMTQKFSEYLTENDIDITTMPKEEFKNLTNNFYKTNFGVTIVCRDDVKYEVRRSLRIATMKIK